MDSTDVAFSLKPMHGAATSDGEDAPRRIGSRAIRARGAGAIVDGPHRREWEPWLLPRTLALYLGMAVGTRIYWSRNFFVEFFFLLAAGIANGIVLRMVRNESKARAGTRRDRKWWAARALRHAEIALVMAKHFLVYAIAYVGNSAIDSALGRSGGVASVAYTMVAIVAISEITDSIGFRQ